MAKSDIRKQSWNVSIRWTQHRTNATFANQNNQIAAQGVETKDLTAQTQGIIDGGSAVGDTSSAASSVEGGHGARSQQPIDDTIQYGGTFLRPLLREQRIEYHVTALPASFWQLRGSVEPVFHGVARSCTLKFPHPVSAKVFQHACSEAGFMSGEILVQMEHFVRVCRGEEKPLCSGMDAIESLAVIAAVRRSAESGLPVRPGDMLAEASGQSVIYKQPLAIERTARVKSEDMSTIFPGATPTDSGVKHSRASQCSASKGNVKQSCASLSLLSCAEKDDEGDAVP
ncbi:unnamed protein product [Prorocentrum cordatum]|uniref:Uncharacterized protein n=1 Tax=Prorocentrum cordatum TaxID=2364126 RepID=A0ABN9YE60_9DINO|nr:unnamed protein product [Polarella glacialis]